MIVKEFNKKMEETLLPILNNFGFTVYKQLEFRKKINDVFHTITFNGRAAKDRSGMICTGAGLGILIPSINDLIYSEEKDRYATLGMPIHLLRAEKDYYLWGFTHTNDIEKGVSIIISDLEKYGFVFLDRFPDSESVFQSVLSGNILKDFMASIDTKNALWVAFTFIKSGKNEALALGEKLMQQYLGKLPKTYRELDKVIYKIKTI